MKARQFRLDRSAEGGGFGLGQPTRKIGHDDAVEADLRRVQGRVGGVARLVEDALEPRPDARGIGTPDRLDGIGEKGSTGSSSDRSIIFDSEDSKLNMAGHRRIDAKNGVVILNGCATIRANSFIMLIVGMTVEFPLLQFKSLIAALPFRRAHLLQLMDVVIGEQAE